ncbi:coiled-coil-helix-coiled-coil-helix domain-containing protein 7 isoform X3 [Parasteatoda tepidariorum]|uniref:coiled-coil-helix-coiled-coil-helix domain-containing protein 7 isoform X3 n=1 Tax=Parasteatoda tepidariorum TaxID=114398 RepID=UPI0039BC9B82
MKKRCCYNSKNLILNFNECLEHKMSLTCLDHNYYDRSKCEAAFKNYKTCKEFWAYVRKDRKRKGLEPHVPQPADRDRIKAEYMPSFRH